DTATSPSTVLLYYGQALIAVLLHLELQLQDYLLPLLRRLQLQVLRATSAARYCWVLPATKLLCACGPVSA
ncbi:hypothetical protein, partial [Paraburkholderia sp. SIMBA_053]|uniref:hypothetical protein n=1 Tax=Paraburkholderia sp. SIMBA_053 TaxID=3085794 RepID=UPI0039799B0D